MAKIINFPAKNSRYSSEIKKLKEISDQIDTIIIESLTDQRVEYKELLALIAHRFGALLSHAEDKKKLWKICQNIICEQARLKKN